MPNYTGSCHCQKVRYEVEADIAKVMACNCSICSRLGTLLTFVPAEKFKLLAGEGELEDYQFGKKHLHHVFCRNCGVHPFASGTGPDGQKMVGVNTRCLEDFDPTTLPVQHYDGRSR